MYTYESTTVIEKNYRGSRFSKSEKCIYLAHRKIAKIKRLKEKKRNG